MVPLHGLDVDMLVRILSEPENSKIEQYKVLLAKDNVKLEFSPESLRAIAQLALERKTGARGLSSILVNNFFLFLKI